MCLVVGPNKSGLVYLVVGPNKLWWPDVSRSRPK